MASRAETTWERQDVAFRNYQLLIARKKRKHELSLLDLLHVSNFKGGNASITATDEEIKKRLKSYSDVLEKLLEVFGATSLAELNERETKTLVADCGRFLRLTRIRSTYIRGLGPSYASALLAAHFPTLVPVLDRRIINGLGLTADRDSQGQVRRIEKHYPEVIRAFRRRLRAGEANDVRELDRVLFAVPLPSPKSKGQRSRSSSRAL